MPVDVKTIVTDAPPLITLATAKSLDYLLYPTLPVIIPDAVFFEATNAAGKLGAQEILDWYRDHMNAVQVEPTEAFAAAQHAARAGRRQRDLGERASLEVIRNYPLVQNERAPYIGLFPSTRLAKTLLAENPKSVLDPLGYAPPQNEGAANAGGQIPVLATRSPRPLSRKSGALFSRSAARK